MKGEKNLVPMSMRSKEEVREIGRKGGIESGKSRRRKKTIKMLLEAFMSKQPTEKKEIKALKEAGFEEEELTNQSLIILSAFKQAKQGNMRAIEFLRDMLGENPQIEFKKELIEEGKNIGAIPVVLVDDVK